VEQVWTAVWPALLVAGLRVGDVTLNVFKVTALVHGRRLAAPLLAGLEAAIWLSAAGVVFAEPSVVRGIGFVAGVALGTALGMSVVHALRLGLVTVRVFATADGERQLAGHFIAQRIRGLGHGATVFDGYGRDAPVHMVLSVVRRREASEVIDVVRRTDPQAFVALDNAPGPGSEIGGVVGARA
jgi:uncharacterized protein YebE (UPF0316 family)